MTMAAFVYKGFDIRFRLLDLAVAANTYEDVLNTLSTGIREAVGRIEGAIDEEGAVDYETEIIENMLGAAHVVCQAQINAVTKAARIIPDLATTFPNDRDVHALGSCFHNNYSKVEVIWALANYFKHRDEWRPDTWVNPTGQSKWTVPVIKAVGLISGSTGNLRKGAEALGNHSYTDVECSIESSAVGPQTCASIFAIDSAAENNCP
jgi:hypothetical protein